MKYKLLLMSALLAGCSSLAEKETSLFLLPEASSAAKVSADITEHPKLVVYPVDLASYLDERNIVYRVSDNQIIQAKSNRWAYSISEQITNRVIEDLRVKQNLFWPVDATGLHAAPADKKLHLKINQFNGSFKGVAEIEGEWILIDANNNAQSSVPMKFDILLEDDGYAALVDALSAGLGKLTDQIASEL